MKRVPFILLSAVLLLVFSSCDFLPFWSENPVAPNSKTAERIVASVGHLRRVIFENEQDAEVVRTETVNEDGTVTIAYESHKDCGLAMYTRIRSGARFTEETNMTTGFAMQSFGYSYLDVITGKVSFSVSGTIVKEESAFTSCTVRYDGKLYDMIDYASSIWYDPNAAAV